MCPYRELLLWRQTIDLAHQIYRATHNFPAEDRGDLAVRLRSVASEIPLHIATHYSCDGATFLRGLKRARCDLLRLEHLVTIANHLHYWPASRALRIAGQLAELRRHLRAFFHSLAPPDSLPTDRRD